MSSHYQSLVHKLTPDLIGKLVDESKDWAQIHGLSMRLADQKDKSDYAQLVPFTLVPSVVPKKLFLEACAVQEDFNFLYHKVAMDFNFIQQSLKRVVNSDPFTANLMEIYRKTHDEQCLQKVQPFVLTIQRSDYMFHNADSPMTFSNVDRQETGLVPCYQLKQVEVNNIAAGGAARGVRVAQLHKRCLSQLAYVDPTSHSARIADNDAVGLVSSALAAAWTAYGEKSAVLLVIIEELNQHVADQRTVEYQFTKRTGAKVRRLTLPQCADQVWLDGNKANRLWITGETLQIGVVYFRSGYLPDHYKSDLEWQTRLKLERSAAIKCPFIGAHLAGTKKIQQVLASTDLNQAFGIDKAIEARLKRTFAKMFSLDMDDPATEKTKQTVAAHPDCFVLKPQLEGGGNNLFGPQVIQTLEDLQAEKLEAYIVMERLRPLQHENIIVKSGLQRADFCQQKVDSELGTFGMVLGTQEALTSENHFGHMLRTKPAHFNECGVSAGFGAHDAPFLV